MIVDLGTVSDVLNEEVKVSLSVSDGFKEVLKPSSDNGAIKVAVDLAALYKSSIDMSAGTTADVTIGMKDAKNDVKSTVKFTFAAKPAPEIPENSDPIVEEETPVEEVVDN